MPQSLVKNYMHLIWSTKYREHLIHPPAEEELHAYLGGICKRMECHPIKIGGYSDHVHVLCMLSKKIALMKLLEEVKSHSSKCLPALCYGQAGMKSKGHDLNNFYWQDGYSVFSVNPAEIDGVIAYIDNQKEHHSKITFQDEYRAILKKCKMEYDERYVWD